MTRPRNWKMPSDAVGVYHVISRCTRRQFLMGKEASHRKAWFIEEMTRLLPVFAVDLLGYAVMSNHVHLVLRSRPDVGHSWSADRVAREGMSIMPLRSGSGDEKLAVTDQLIAQQIRNRDWVDEYRARLSSISWLMRLIKQRISRRANREDGCTGHFWESRFTSVPLLDWSAVLACLVYVDLNPHRAGMVDRPQQASHCSIRCHLGLSPRQVDVMAAKCLVALGDAGPFDAELQAIPEYDFSQADYSQLIKITTARRLSRQQESDLGQFSAEHGFDPATWREKMPQAGLFQSGAVGSPERRRSYAESVGKKWIADKTGIWL